MEAGKYFNFVSGLSKPSLPLLLLLLLSLLALLQLLQLFLLLLHLLLLVLLLLFINSRFCFLRLFDDSHDSTFLIFQAPWGYLDRFPISAIPGLLPYVSILAPDKRGCPHSIFLISSWRHMLCVPIRSASPRRGASNEYPQHMFHGEIRKENKKKCQYFLVEKAPYLEL